MAFRGRPPGGRLLCYGAPRRHIRPVRCFFAFSMVGKRPFFPGRSRKAFSPQIFDNREGTGRGKNRVLNFDDFEPRRYQERPPILARDLPKTPNPGRTPFPPSNPPLGDEDVLRLLSGGDGFFRRGTPRYLVPLTFEIIIKDGDLSDSSGMEGVRLLVLGRPKRSNVSEGVPWPPEDATTPRRGSAILPESCMPFLGNMVSDKNPTGQALVSRFPPALFKKGFKGANPPFWETDPPAPGRAGSSRGPGPKPLRLIA